MKDDDRRSRVARLAFQRDAEAVAFLMQRGADPAGDGPAVCCPGEAGDEIENRNCERTTEMLVGAGVNPNAVNEPGVTPRHEAASRPAVQTAANCRVAQACFGKIGVAERL